MAIETMNETTHILSVVHSVYKYFVVNFAPFFEYSVSRIPDSLFMSNNY